MSAYVQELFILYSNSMHVLQGEYDGSWSLNVAYDSLPFQSAIWGLSKKGKTCKACGISVHSKCELKVGVNRMGRTPYPDGEVDTCGLSWVRRFGET